jgi:hypothetical protein
MLVVQQFLLAALWVAASLLLLRLCGFDIVLLPQQETKVPA